MSLEPQIALSPAPVSHSKRIWGRRVSAIAGFVVTVFLTFLGLLAITQDWFHDVQPWVDLDFQLAALQQGSFDSEQWTQLAATSGLWLVLPLVVGMWTLVRSEVK